MARTRKISRRNYTQIDFSAELEPSSSRRSKTIVDTSQYTRLIYDAQLIAGKWPRRELFKCHGVAEATGYYILKSNSSRCSQSIYNRGRKPILEPYQCDTIKAVEDASFRFRTAIYYANAKLLGLADGSECAV
jgi:hypothetical protein